MYSNSFLLFTVKMMQQVEMYILCSPQHPNPDSSHNHSCCVSLFALKTYNINGGGIRGTRENPDLLCHCGTTWENTWGCLERSDQRRAVITLPMLYSLTYSAASVVKTSTTQTQNMCWARFWKSPEKIPPNNTSSILKSAAVVKNPHKFLSFSVVAVKINRHKLHNRILVQFPQRAET